MRIAVTGAWGRLGRCVVDDLLRDSAVDAVVALDRSEPLRSHSKLTAVRCDVREPQLDRHLRGCDAVIHLAFDLEPCRGRTPIEEDANAAATFNVFGAIARSGVPQAVFASSSAAYGVHEEHRGFSLTEQVPTRGDASNYLSRHKAAMEDWLDVFEARHRGVRVVRLRSSAAVSTELLGWFDALPASHAFYLRTRDGGGPLQLTWERDVASAFVLAAKSTARGAFNVAADDGLTPRQMGIAMGRSALPLPGEIVHCYRAAWRHGWGRVDPLWLEYSMGQGLLVSSRKIREELGWTPRFETTGEVLRAVAGRPNARASHAVRGYLGVLARLSRLRRGLPTRNLRSEPVPQGTVNLRLRGDRGGAYYLHLAPERMAVFEGTHVEPRATLSVRERTFVDLLLGKIQTGSAVRDGAVGLSGDESMSCALGLLVDVFQHLREGRGRVGWLQQRYTNWVLREVAN